MSDPLKDIEGTAWAARKLSKTPEYVARLCAAGRLKAKRVGRDWAIWTPSVTAYQQKGRKAGRPPKMEANP